MTTKVLLDTDIGGDIDDAVALAYLLSQPRCDLLGITTVTGQAQERGKLASALCHLAGRKVPIHLGAEQPLLLQRHVVEAPQAAALESWRHDTDFPDEPAVDFLRRTIRQHPDEITLVTIGPLTNIALLFAVDPEIPGLLREVVSMAGAVTPGIRRALDWNTVFDPHAAAMVYRTRLRRHRTVGLEVTMQVTMTAAEVRKRFGHGLLQPVRDFAEVWFRDHDEITFHDPLAAAVIFDEQICGFDRGRLSLDPEPGDLSGLMRWSPDDRDGPHEVATTLAAQRFFDHYFSVVDQSIPR